MVKNTGGNKAKKYASKSFNVSDRTTRFATDKDEMYAVVNKMLGSNNCEVLGIDGKTRLCVIRGKFSGKGKRDNRLFRGKWVLVGLRSWEVSSKDKEKCDLLEVYSDNDKEKLIRNSKESFRIFLSVTQEDEEVDQEHVQFINNREEELFEESQLEEEKKCETEDQEKFGDTTYSLTKQMDWISIDDI